MKKSSKINSVLQECVKEISDNAPTSPDTLNTVEVENRDFYIKSLLAAQNSLEIALAEIKSIYDREMEIQNCALANIERVLARIKGTSEEKPIEKINPWKLVPARSKPPTKQIIPQTKSKLINIIGAIHIPAIAVESITDVVSSGEIYYIENIDHFAVKFDGLMLHGNIGIIFDDKLTPTKVKSCTYGDSCSKKSTCDFYHDPIRSISTISKERRNYVKSNWIYTGSSTQSVYTRHFGSLDKLENDIQYVTFDEIMRLKDQVMHDLLCLLVLSTRK